VEFPPATTRKLAFLFVAIVVLAVPSAAAADIPDPMAQGPYTATQILVKFGPIAPGESATIDVPLRSSALKLLARLGTLKVKVTTSLSDPRGSVSPRRFAKTLKVKKG
jgi:hypothetical protein